MPMYPKLKLKSCEEFLNLTIVTMQNRYGKYVGISELHDEDKPYKSSLIGGSYAENRAVASYIKERLKESKIKLKTIQNLKKDFEHSKLEIPRPIKLKLRDYTQEVDDLTNYLYYLNHYIEEAEKHRAKLRKKD